MARVTVEDCVKKISNRFELVVLASERVRDILSGAPIEVARDNDKNPVVALREIAQGCVSAEELTENLIKGHQKHAPIEDEEDILEALADEQNWLSDPESEEMKTEIEEEGLHLVDDPEMDIQE